jgi:seryl-tRNA synthetase
MLDLRRIRQDPATCRATLLLKGEPGTADTFDALLEADARWRGLLAEVERLRAERNALSGEVARARRAVADGAAGADLQELLRRSRGVADRLRAIEPEVAPAELRVRELLLQLPNYPDPDVPPGADDSANLEVRRVGTPRATGFPLRPHWELGPGLGVLDFERAARISGSRFTVFLDRGARLVRALVAWMCDLHTRSHGCVEVLPPFVVTAASMLGTGQLPKFGADAFAVAGTELWLVPTAEVPVTNLYRDEILPAERLPIRHVAYTPCWRSEAGAAGRDTRGLIRQHQFDKVEIVHLCAPEDSPRHLEEIVACAEAVLRALELPYRVVEMCAGDLGFSAARKYDLEVWMPSYGRYVEISSCSNFRDFQARRAGIRFRRARGAPVEFVHTLNGSALAVGRTIAALLENRQEEDGSVTLPAVLGPYLNGDLRWAPPAG